MSPESAQIEISAGAPDRAYWRDLWRYRELLGFLAWRDVKVRYKQAVLGIAWALFQPLVTMVIFNWLFYKQAKMDAGQIPSSLVVLTGLLAWQLFSAGFNGASGSLLNNASLVSKVYFPRLIIPMSALAVALVDFVVVVALYVGVVAWHCLDYFRWGLPIDFVPTWRVLLLPVFILNALAVAFGTGAWLTALMVRFRDFRFIAPFLIQVGLFVSPVAYRIDNLPNWHGLIAFNPLTGVIGGFRWCLLGEEPRLVPYDTLVGFAVTAFLVVSGVYWFRRTERSLADEI